MFVFFGLVATMGTRFVYDETMPAAAWVGAVVMGLLASAILVANNVRDIEGDRRVGKRTLAVILGRRRTRVLYTALVGGSFLTVVVAVATGVLPAAALLALIAVPLALQPGRAVLTSTAGTELIVGLRGTARLQIVVAVLLAAGLVV